MTEEEIPQIEGIDRIELHTTAKGLIQASVKIHKKMDSTESIDELIRLEKYAWAKLRENFTNLIWAEGERNDKKDGKLDDDND